MNIIRFIFLLLTSISVASAAQEPKLSPPPAQDSPMATAIENTQFITEHKPNPRAQYYMFLYTGSWCSPCRAIMPKIVAEYSQMMTNRHMEVIVISFDDTPEAARAYLTKSNAPFAAVMNDSPEPAKLPGCRTDVYSIPHIVVVDSAGQFIYRGHALRYSEWKRHTQNTPSPAHP